LLEKPLSELPPQVKNLIIVPDGLLGYVPFEILGKPEGQVDFKNYPYLLRQFNISYAASANLLLDQSRSTEKPEPEELFAGFAPSYSDSDTLGLMASTRRRELVRDDKYDLPGAAREVQEIAAMLGGKPFLGADATEHNFKENALRFRILHLAMHSLPEDRNPLFSKLLFTQNPKDSVEDNDLNAAELYNMHLPASLVVLSACNTGTGRLYRGEGILSLSRAFTYTGVPATVMSLWQAPDEATRQVMVGFYKNLKLGMRKDEALRQAKLSYLADCRETLSSPYYWAGFVASGEMKELFGKR
jgi:CHAT domain-containing protein